MQLDPLKWLSDDRKKAPRPAGGDAAQSGGAHPAGSREYARLHRHPRTLLPGAGRGRGRRDALGPAAWTTRWCAARSPPATPRPRSRRYPPRTTPCGWPMRSRRGSMTLRADGPEYVPLRVFRDDDLLDPGSDPLIALMGALANLNEGERVMARLLLRSLGPDWSEAHLEKAHKRPAAGAAQSSYAPQAGTPQAADGLGMAVLGTSAFIALKAYQWVQAGETWKATLLGLGVTAGLIVAGWVKARFFKDPPVYDPLLIREKVSRIAFDAELQVTAILPDGARPHRAKELLEPVAAAYRHFDNPAGARFKVGKVQPAVPDPAMLHPSSPGLFGKRSVLGVREAACLWHPPGARDETPLVARAGAKVLLPTARSVSGGAHVGDTVTGTPRKIHFPGRPAQTPPPLRRPHPHGQVHPHAAHRPAQAPREGCGQGPRRHRRRGPPRRPGGRPAGARPRVARRAGAPHRPGRRAGSARDQPAGHPHLRRPRPYRRFRRAHRQGPVGPVGAADAVDFGADRQDPARGQ